MKYIKIGKNGTITLLSPFRPTEFAERAPSKGLSIQQINKEVHAMRKEKKVAEIRVVFDTKCL